MIVNTVQVGTNGAITLDGHHLMIGRRYTATPITYIRRGQAISIFNDHGLVTEFKLTPTGYQSAHGPSTVCPRSPET